MTRDLTLILPHFCNLGMLAEQQRVWADYPDRVKRRLRVIVVDGGSPKASRPNQKSIRRDLGLASISLYRAMTHVRWGWLFSRNLGVQQAVTSWVILTDIDHVLPAETLGRLVNGPLDEVDVYRLSRVDAPRPWPYALSECSPYKPHPNTWLMTRAMYQATGGYDERLLGCYGTDGEFRDRVRLNARAIHLLSESMIRYPRTIIPDASTTMYTRKGDAENDADLIRRREARALIPDWRPLRVTLPWEHLLTVTAPVREASEACV